MSANAIIVDDQDPRLKYTGSGWTLGGSEVNFSRTLYSSGKVGATMSFVFKGSSLTVVGDLTAGGTCTTTFAVDGATTRYTSPDVSTHHQTLWTSPPLKDDVEHTFIYSILSCTSSTGGVASDPFVWLDYLLYVPSKSVNRDGVRYFVDDSDPRVQYSGQWDTTNNDEDFMHTRHSGSDGSSLTYEFEGTSISVHGRVSSSTSGKDTRASFSIDGSTSSAFAAPAQDNVSFNKALYTSDTLTPGRHTIVVRAASENPVCVDYFLVQPLKEGQTPTAGSLSTAAIIGMSVGGVVLVAFIAFALYRFKKYQPKGRIPPSKRNDVQLWPGLSDRGVRNPYLPAQMPQASTGRRSPSRSASAVASAVSPTDSRPGQFSHQRSNSQTNSYSLSQDAISPPITGAYNFGAMQSPSSAEFDRSLDSLHNSYQFDDQRTPPTRVLSISAPSYVSTVPSNPFSRAPSVTSTDVDRRSQATGRTRRNIPSRVFSMSAPSYVSTVESSVAPSIPFSRSPSLASNPFGPSGPGPSSQAPAPMPFLDEDPDSVAALKRRQKAAIQAQEGLRHAPSASSMASYRTTNSNATFGTHPAASPRSLAHSETNLRPNERDTAPSSVPVDPTAWEDDLPPVYTPH